MRLGIVAAALMLVGLMAAPASADTLVPDSNLADEFTNPEDDLNGIANPGTPSDPATEEAWLEALLGTDVDFIEPPGQIQNPDGGGDSLTNYDPGFDWTYAIVKFGNNWAAYLDDGDDNLLTVGPFGPGGGISHVSFFDGNGTTVPEPSLLVLLGSGLVAVGAFARSRRCKE